MYYTRWRRGKLSYTCSQYSRLLFSSTASSSIGTKPALVRLASAWQNDAMDALLLLIATDRADGHQGVGDFFCGDQRRLTRRGDAKSAPYVYTGIQLLHPRLFEGCKAEPFSLNRLYDRAMAHGRLYGLAHEGKWHDVGTPERLQQLNLGQRAVSSSETKPGAVDL